MCSRPFSASKRPSQPPTRGRSNSCNTAKSSLGHLERRTKKTSLTKAGKPDTHVSIMTTYYSYIILFSTLRIGYMIIGYKVKSHMWSIPSWSKVGSFINKVDQIYGLSLIWSILGQNSTFFRGTLEKLPSEARGWQFLTRVPRKKVEFYHYTLVLQGFPIILAEQCL